MSEERRTVEQEAALVLEQMARLKQQNAEATIEVCRSLESHRAMCKRDEDIIAQVNAERDTELAILEQRAKELGLRAEGTIKTDHGSINYRRGYPKVSYDAKQLDAVAKMPAHEWILAYRSMTEVGPSVTVTLAKGSK